MSTSALDQHVPELACLDTAYNDTTIYNVAAEKWTKHVRPGRSQKPAGTTIHCRVPGFPDIQTCDVNDIDGYGIGHAIFRCPYPGCGKALSRRHTGVMRHFNRLHAKDPRGAIAAGMRWWSHVTVSTYTKWGTRGLGFTLAEKRILRNGGQPVFTTKATAQNVANAGIDQNSISMQQDLPVQSAVNTPQYATNQATTPGAESDGPQHAQDMQSRAQPQMQAGLMPDHRNLHDDLTEDWNAFHAQYSTHPSRLQGQYMLPADFSDGLISDFRVSNEVSNQLRDGYGQFDTFQDGIFDDQYPLPQYDISLPSQNHDTGLIFQQTPAAQNDGLQHGFSQTDTHTEPIQESTDAMDALFETQSFMLAAAIDTKSRATASLALLASSDEIDARPPPSNPAIENPLLGLGTSLQSEPVHGNSQGFLSYDGVVDPSQLVAMEIEALGPFEANWMLDEASAAEDTEASSPSLGGWALDMSNEDFVAALDRTFEDENE